MIGRHIVKDKGNSVVLTFIHHAVLFLIIDLVSLAHFKAIGFAINHKAHSGIGGNGNMDAMPGMKRGMFIKMRGN